MTPLKKVRQSLRVDNTKSHEKMERINGKLFLTQPIRKITKEVLKLKRKQLKTKAVQCLDIRDLQIWITR